MELNDLNTEIANWLCALETMQRENIGMKTRLAQIVKQAISPTALDEAEHFQSCFLNKDAVIAFLRADIKKHGQKITNSQNNTDIHKWQSKLHLDMQRMEARFRNLTSDFENYQLQFTKTN